MKIPFTDIELFSRKGLTTKGLSGGIQWAMVQNNQVYTIGNNPTSYIKQGYKENALVYAAVSTIASACRRAHFKLFDVRNRNQKTEVTAHPLLDMLNRPNPMQSKATFIDGCITYYLLTGECFMVKLSPGLGSNKDITQNLITYSPQYIKVTQDPNSGLPAGYLFDNNRRKIEIPADDMIFWKRTDPEGSIRGMSPLMAARRVIVHSNNAYEANMKLTQNMGPSGILAYPADYDDTQLDQLQKKYESKYGGPKNYGKTMFTTGDVKWIATGFKAEDLQLVEGQRMSLRDLCNIYNISSQLLNDPENKTYNNMQDARRALILNAVLPLMKEFCDVLNSYLLPEFEKRDGTRYELEVDKHCWEEIWDDLQVQANTAAQAWWLTLNERRQLMGFDALDIPQGSNVFIPNNIRALSGETGNTIERETEGERVNTPEPTQQEIPDDASELTLDDKCLTLTPHHQALAKALKMKDGQLVSVITKDGKSVLAKVYRKKYINLRGITANDIAFIAAI